MLKYPRVVDEDVNGFATAWDYRGLKMMLDPVSRRFALDFANTVLRSYVDDLVVKAKAGQKLAKSIESETALGVSTTVPEKSTPVPKSSIVLTDAA